MTPLYHAARHVSAAFQQCVRLEGCFGWSGTMAGHCSIEAQHHRQTCVHVTGRKQQSNPLGFEPHSAACRFGTCTWSTVLAMPANPWGSFGRRGLTCRTAPAGWLMPG